MTQRMTSCQQLKVQNFVDCGQSNWFTLKLMINSMFSTKWLMKFFTNIWESRDECKVCLAQPHRWAHSATTARCFLVNNGVPEIRYTLYYLTSLQPTCVSIPWNEICPKGGKNISGHPDIKETANAKSKVSFGYLWWIIGNFKWQLVGKLQLSLLSVVKKSLGISW